MHESTFDQALDALVAGQQPEQQDDLIRFVADIYRKEQDVKMPTYHRIQLASELGLGGAPIAINAPSGSVGPEKGARGRSRHLTWLAIAAAVVLAMTGLFNWGLPNGDNDDRFLGVPSAIPTVQATPVAATSPNAEWLMPISPYDCGIAVEYTGTPESPVLAVQEFPARADYPLQLASYQSRIEAWNAARDMRACMNSIGIQTFWSARYTYEQSVMPLVDPDGYNELAVDRIQRGQVLSVLYTDMVGLTPDALVLRFDVGDSEVEGLDPGTYPIINPDWIVQAPDGRMIVLVTSMVVSDGELPLSTPDASQPGGLAWVLIQVDGEWLIDEYLPVCIGDEDSCEKFWRQQPGWATYETMRTPNGEACAVGQDFSVDYEADAGRPINLRPGPGIASGDPVAVIVDGQALQYLCQRELTTDPEGDGLYEGQSWLFIRTADGYEGWVREIDVRPVPQKTASPDLDSTSVAAVTLLKPVTAEECRFLPVDDPTLEPQIPSQMRISSSDYTHLETPSKDDSEAAALAARQVDSCTGSANPTDFLTSSFAATTYQNRVFHPLLPLQNEQTLQDSKDISAAFATESDLTPSDLVIVIGEGNPESAIVPPGDYPLPLAEFAMSTSDGRIAVLVVMASVNPVAPDGTRLAATGLGMVYVMAEEDGTWKLDDVLYLCVGKCDEYFAQLEAVAHMSSWLRPITTEECVGNYGVLLSWDASRIVAIGSRQYLACLEDGGTFALKTSEFQMADMNTAKQLSIEIDDGGGIKDNVKMEVYAELFHAADLPEGPYPAFDPDNAVVLPDGRIAILQSEVTATQTSMPGATQSSQVVTRALVWREVDGTWLLDTEAEICLGDCEAFWSDGVATPTTTVVPLEPVGTEPAPTPTQIFRGGDNQNQLPPIEPVDVLHTPTSAPGS